MKENNLCNNAVMLINYDVENYLYRINEAKKDLSIFTWMCLCDCHISKMRRKNIFKGWLDVQFREMTLQALSAEEAEGLRFQIYIFVFLYHNKQLQNLMLFYMH